MLEVLQVGARNKEPPPPPPPKKGFKQGSGGQAQARKSWHPAAMSISLQELRPPQERGPGQTSPSPSRPESVELHDVWSRGGADLPKGCCYRRSASWGILSFFRPCLVLLLSDPGNRRTVGPINRMLTDASTTLWPDLQGADDLLKQLGETRARVGVRSMICTTCLGVRVFAIELT